MADAVDALAALRPDERARLDQFAKAFERIGSRGYAMLTETAPTDAVRAAQERALERLGTGSRKAAVRAAVDAFVDHAALAYSSLPSLTDTFLLNQSLGDRAEDRVRFLQTVEHAVVALILWDELDPDDSAALLGPWSAVVIPDPSG